MCHCLIFCIYICWIAVGYISFSRQHINSDYKKPVYNQNQNNIRLYYPTPSLINTYNNRYLDS